MAERVICDLCGTAVAPHAHYIVRIEVFADPALPATTSDDLDEADLQKQMLELIEQMKLMSADELQDQVHRRFEYRLCRACQSKYLANPLGRPRESKTSSN